MPQYEFIHEKTGEIHTIILSMKEEKVYAGPKGNQKGQWKRVWSVPGASVDTVIDPHSAADFVKVTNKKGGTMGELWERSAELSAKRADKEGGIDPVKQGYYDRFAAKRRGKKHPQQVREETVRMAREAGINIEGLD